MKTHVCRKCGQERPAEDFPYHEHADEGRASVALCCWGDQGYIDPDAPRNTPRMSLEEVKAAHDLSVDELEIAKEAADAIRKYREWYTSDKANNQMFEKQTAGDVVDQYMPESTAREKHRVLDVACAMAIDDGVDLTSRATVSEARGDVA